MRYVQRLSLLLVLAAAGCTTMAGARRQEAEARRLMIVRQLQSEVSRLSDRLDGLQLAQEDLYRRIEQLQGAAAAGRGDLERRVHELDTAVQATEAARAALKRELVESLPRKMAEAIRAQQPPPPPRQRGYEHVVEAGQTLSEIAAAYGVRVQVVVEANNLRSADNIRVGQKLFIPE
jgi:nucleoid-associated protein YgaU